jgi:hypothetical protein
MPRVFHPGHRPSQPLYPDDLVYTTVQKVSEYLQLPLPEPVILAGDTTVDTGANIDASLTALTNYILIPIGGADYRRWGFSAGDSITVYDDVESMGSTLSVSLVKSAGTGGKVNLIAEDPGVAYTTAQGAVVQANSSISNSKERGLSKSHVEDLIRQRQDYIDRTTRMSWRPSLVSDEYQNFTTFKPYRRRYYTDYVGAVYLKNRAVQRILRLSVWQGDYYRELGASRIKLSITNPIQIQASDKFFLCPGGVNATATLEQGVGNNQWSKDFGIKTIAQQISNLINMDAAAEKTAIQIGSLTEGTDPNGVPKPLNVSHEFLATANSDDGDGKIMISSMRSTEEGENATIGVTNTNSFTFTLGATHSTTITSVTGGSPITGFVVDDAGTFTEGHGIVCSGNHVALCTRVGNTFTIVTDLSGTFGDNVLATDTLTQHRFNSDATSEERQTDWWSMEDNGAIMFNNQYPFFENHSLKISYVYGERYVDKMIEDACTKLVVIDILMADDYSVMFPEGSQGIDLNAKVQRLETEAKQLLVPFQESIIVAGMGG